MADHKQVLVVYKERRKVFKIPQECDIGHNNVEVVRAFDFNKTLGRALDPRANGTWLSKLTE